MAVYGLSYYGQDVYGLPGFGARAGRGFSAEPFRVEPTDVPTGGQPYGPGRYNQLLLRWAKPVGEWSNIRVLRNFSGYPMSIFDGNLVYEGTKAAGVTALVDTGLTGGLSAYYTIFVQADDGVWFRGANAWSLVVEDHGFHERLQDALPDSAIRADYESSKVLPDERKYPLSRFLEALAFELDRSKTTLNSLLHLYDPDVTPAAALPLLSDQFGIVSEPSIGISRLRAVARNASYLQRAKGTLPGVEALASVFTGWGAEVTVGKNLMLRDDHADWVGPSFNVDILAASDTPFSDVTFGVRLQADHGSLGETTVHGDGGGDTRLHGIPFSGGMFTLTMEVFAATNYADAWLRMEGVDTSGATDYLMENAPADVQTLTVGAWTTLRLTADVPVGDRFLNPILVLKNTVATGDEFYVRNIQFEAGDTPTTYEPPRQAIITFEPPYTNHITTPSFEGGVTPAFITANATSSTVNTRARSGDFSLLVTPATLGAPTSVTSLDTMPVQAGDPAMVRASVYPVGAPVDVTVGIEWLDGAGTVVEAESEVVTVSADVWGDIFMVKQAPNAERARLYLSWEDVPVHLDAMALVDTYGIEYFDGDSLPGETIWGSGGAHMAPTYYYPMRPVRQARLRSVLPDFLPLGREASFVYAGES